MKANQGRGHGFRRAVGQQLGGELQFLRRGGLVQQRVFEQPDLVFGADFFGQRRAGPLHVEIGDGEQTLRRAAFGVRDHDDRDALLAGPARSTATVQQACGVGGQVGVDDQTQVREVQAARCDVSGDTGPRMSVPQ